MSHAETRYPRVLHLRSSGGFYGAENVIHSLVRQYPGEMITVCLSDARAPHTELCDRLNAEGYATETLETRGAVDPKLPFRLAALVRRVRPDVIHTHEYKTDALVRVSRAIFPSLRRIPAVATMHGVVRISGALRRYERVDARALRGFDAVAPVSAELSQVARAYGVPEGRIHEISNGVDTDRFRPAQDRRTARQSLGLPADGVLIGVVGRLSPEKALLLMLDAFQASGLAPSARLAFFGDGPQREELDEHAKALGIADRVHQMGRRDDMPNVYGALDLLAMSSQAEGLPMTLLEGAACGVPVVATDVGDIARALPHERAALIVPPGDREAFTAALRRSVAEPEAMRALAETARRRVEEQYSARAMAGEYERLYRRLLGRGAQPEALAVERRP